MRFFGRTTTVFPNVALLGFGFMWGLKFGWLSLIGIKHTASSRATP